MLLLEILQEDITLEDLGIDGKVILECILRKCGGKEWTRFIWLRTGTGGELL
jgi:hypothetical protein